MERVEDQGWEGEKAFTAGLYCVQEEEDPVLWGEASMQTLFAISHSLRLQGYHPESGATDGLYGYVGQAAEKDGGSRYKDYSQGRN